MWWPMPSMGCADGLPGGASWPRGRGRCDSSAEMHRPGVLAAPDASRRCGS